MMSHHKRNVIAIFAIGVCMFFIYNINIREKESTEKVESDILALRPQENTHDSTNISTKASTLAKSSAIAKEAKSTTFDSTEVRSIIKYGQSEKLEQAFEQIDRCANIKTMRNVQYAIDRNSEASKALPSLEESLKADELFCSTADHELISRRSQYLREAINRSFTPGLAHRFYLAGPGGNWDELQLRPTDQIVKDWIEESKIYLSRAAEMGDKQAMQDLSDIFRSGPEFQTNAIKAFGYQLALAELQGVRDDGKSKGPTAKYLELEKSKLNQSEILAAKKEAANLLAKCCASRQSQ